MRFERFLLANVYLVVELEGEDWHRRIRSSFRFLESCPLHAIFSALPGPGALSLPNLSFCRSVLSRVYLFIKTRASSLWWNIHTIYFLKCLVIYQNSFKKNQFLKNKLNALFFLIGIKKLIFSYKFSSFHNLSTYKKKNKGGDLPFQVLATRCFCDYKYLSQLIII